MSRMPHATGRIGLLQDHYVIHLRIEAKVTFRSHVLEDLQYSQMMKKNNVSKVMTV